MAETATDNSDIISDLLGKSADLLSQDFAIPTYKGVGTGKATADLNTAKKTQEELRKTVDTSKDTYGKATENLKDADTGVGQAKADMAYANQAQAEEIAATHRMTNELFGVGVNASDAIAVMATENRTKVKPQLDAELQKVHDLSSVGPLDSPLEWLFNGLQMPAAQQAYNATAAKYNNNQEMIEKGIADSTALALQVNRGIPTITAAQAKATADEAVFEANKLKAVADQNFAIHSVDLVNTKLAGDLAIAGDSAKLTGLQIEEQKAKYSSEIQAIQLQDTHAARLMKAAEFYEKLDDINKQKEVLANAEDKLGYKRGTLTPAGIKAMGDKGKQVIAIGVASSFGTTPLDAYETAINLKLGPGVSEDTIKVIKYIGDKLKTLQKGLAENAVFKSLTPDEKRARVSGGLNTLIDTDIAEAEKAGSPFHELSPAKIMMADKDFTNSPVGKILQPIATKDQITMPKDVVATILAGVDDNPSIAGGMIADYYKKNMEIRNSSIPFKGVGGISVPKDYMVTLNGESFDLTQPGQAGKYAIMTKLNARRADTYKNIGNITNPSGDITGN